MPVVMPHSQTEMLDRQRREAEREVRKYRTMIQHIEKVLCDDQYDSQEIVEQLIEYIEKRKNG